MHTWRVVNALAFAPDGKEVVVGSGAATATDTWEKWASGSRRETCCENHFFSEPGGIFSVAWAHRGQVLAAGGPDGTITLLTLLDDQRPADPSSRACRARPSVVFSPNDGLLASGGDDTTVRSLGSVDRVS